MRYLKKFNENANFDKIADIFRASGEGEDELDYLTSGEQEGELWDMLRNGTITIEDLKSFRDNPTGNITIGVDDNGIIDSVIKDWEDENIDNDSGTDKFAKTLIGVPLADDWEGMYHNGTLIYEGHSIRWDMVIDELIKEEVNLSGYKHLRLNHYKDGEFTDFPTDSNIHSFPKNIADYISELKKHGYDYKFS